MKMAVQIPFEETLRDVQVLFCHWATGEDFVTQKTAWQEGGKCRAQTPSWPPMADHSTALASA